MRRLAIALLLAALLGAGCGDMEDHSPNPNAIVRLEGPEKGTIIEGNVATLRVRAEGLRIVKADGDESGDSGHFHVFVDRPPVAPGEVIPKTKDVIHTTETRIVVPGLDEGQHQIYVVLGDGTHHRLGRSVVHTSVNVEGPTVVATGPSVANVGEPIHIEVHTEGVSIVPADGDTSGDTGHLHVFVDKAPTAAGQTIAREEGVIHTTERKVEIPAFTTPGDHTIWVVFGDGNHIPFDPPVMDRLIVTVA